MTYFTLFSTPANWSGKDFTVKHMGCTINFFRGKKEIRFSQFSTKFITPSKSIEASNIQTATTEPNNAYIAIYADHVHRKEGPSLSEARTKIAEVIAYLCCTVSANLFDTKIAEGTIIKEKNDFILGGSIKTIEPPRITRDLIQSSFSDEDIRKKADKRFSLMSTFYSRAWPLESTEEKYLLLWTILEIYPMSDTSNIDPIYPLLQKIIFKDLGKAEINERIHVGRLYGFRCKIVHDGYIETETHKLTRSIGTLLDITRTTMRYYLGLPYDGVLDKYPIDE